LRSRDDANQEIQSGHAALDDGVPANRGVGFHKIDAAYIDLGHLLSNVVRLIFSWCPGEKADMRGSNHVSAPSRRPAVAVGACLLLAAGLAGSAAFGQDQSAATPSDAIYARKTVMDTISEKMDALEAATASTKNIEINGAREQVDVISVLLMAFPHMFPTVTNQWKPNVDKDPATDTFAAPEVWTKFADFYKQASDASKLAYDASRATQEADLRSAIAQLRTACDGCHATYQKTE
jgi:cytochrome c556